MFCSISSQHVSIYAMEKYRASEKQKKKEEVSIITYGIANKTLLLNTNPNSLHTASHTYRTRNL